MALPQWVKPEHIAWSSVITAGPVDIEWKSRHEGPDHLPGGYRMSLRDIDKQDIATCYREEIGVVRLPAWCLDPWDR